MCQAKDLASGDAVSPAALHPSVGADANDTHGGWMRRRALEHPESILARDLLIASGWIEHLNAENSRLREALEPFARESDEWNKIHGDALRPVCSTPGCDSCGKKPPKWELAQFTLGDLRRARAALASAPRPSEEERSDDTASPVARRQPDTSKGD